MKHVVLNIFTPNKLAKCTGIIFRKINQMIILWLGAFGIVS